MGRVNTNRFWLGLVIVALSLPTVALAQPSTTKMSFNHPGYGPSKLTLSKEPIIGEIVTVTYEVTPKADIPQAVVEFGVNEGVKIVGGNSANYELINPKTVRYLCSVKKNITQSFSIKVIFNGAKANGGRALITADAYNYYYDKNVIKLGETFGVADLMRSITDEKIGQMGTEEEKYKGLIYHYDNVDGSFRKESMPGMGVQNLQIIETLRKMEPSLSDSEALCLHADQYKAGIPYGCQAQWIEKEQKWDDSKRFRFYLDNGWLKAFRSGGREQWAKEMLEKNRKSWEGGNKVKTGFFRDGRDLYNTGSIGDNVDGKTMITINFDGNWLYKKHQYNKDQGLLSSYAIKPIQSAKARLMLYFEIGTNWYRYLTSYCTTNDTGGFAISYELDADATNCKAYPVIYPSGPNPASPSINVSDPNHTLPTYWKDPNDSTLYIMRELGQATYHVFYANTTPKHLGTIWTDTFPAVAQPQSGCINIYETLLKGYNKLVPS